MYRAFVEGRAEREIAVLLNDRGIVTDLGRPWTRGTVHQVLINGKYAGDNVWNRISFKLKKKRVRNSPDTWIRADGVFAPIIDRKLFETRSEEHTSELQSLMRISYAVFCLKKKRYKQKILNKKQ